MKSFFLILLFAFLTSSASAAPQIQRAPVDADYVDFLKNADKRCDSCELLLTVRGDSQPHTSPLAYVRAKNAKKDDGTEIQAAYFQLAKDNDKDSGFSTGKASVTDYSAFGVATERLKDAQASNFYTGDALRTIATHNALSPMATIIVSRSNPVDTSANFGPIDTSILIRYGSSSNFIIEQASEIPRFAANMKRLHDRRYSQKITLFDFAPRSRAAIKNMDLEGSALIWQLFSTRISLIFSSYGKPEAIGQRSKDALLARLKDPTGGVVVLYAHSDGKDIVLDTADGVVRLTPDDIAKVGKAAGGQLPPVVLLNCETRAVLGPAFLAAGSPFVATTDQKLGLFEAGNFVSQFAKALYVGEQDVIDAYFTAQQIASPTRLRPIAENQPLASQTLLDPVGRRTPERRS